MTSNASTSPSPARKRLFLNLLGLGILLGGYCVALLIWQAQNRLDQQQADLASNPAAPLSALDSKKDTREMEVTYGKSGVLMESVSEWFTKMTHGRPLAKNIIVLSSLAAIGCFVWAARRGPAITSS